MRFLRCEGVSFVTWRPSRRVSHLKGGGDKDPGEDTPRHYTVSGKDRSQLKHNYDLVLILVQDNSPSLPIVKVHPVTPSLPFFLRGLTGSSSCSKGGWILHTGSSRLSWSPYVRLLLRRPQNYLKFSFLHRLWRSQEVVPVRNSDHTRVRDGLWFTDWCPVVYWCTVVSTSNTILIILRLLSIPTHLSRH